MHQVMNVLASNNLPDSALVHLVQPPHGLRDMYNVRWEANLCHVQHVRMEVRQVGITQFA